MKNSMEKIYFWGTGNIALQINNSFKDMISGMKVSGFIDNDQKKEGTLFLGKTCYSPDVLLSERNSRIIILSTDFENIQKQIETDYPWNIGRVDNFLLFIKCRLLSRYTDSKDKQIQEICKYLNQNPLQIFNYSFTQKYKKLKVKIEHDVDKGLYFTYYNNKKLYFSRRFKTKESAENYYRQIAMEQDACSPHNYTANNFYVSDGDVVVDAGAAEGNFALSVIDRVNKIYLFEPDEEWVEALNYTFEAYREKVVIINKYVSEFDSADTCMIDSCISENVNFIKMDIEGEEYYALKGAKSKILSSDKLKCAICVYHQEFDALAVDRLLNEYKLNTNYTDGYMWFPYDKDAIYSLPTLRKVILQAER